MTVPFPRVPFYFLRHGVTDHNVRRLVMGQLDVPLNDQGRHQARLAADRIRLVDIAAIVCSPLSRARETAEIVAAKLGVEVTVIEDLRERDWGEASGRPYRELFRQEVPLGAEPGEAFSRRVIAAVARLTKDKTVLMVSHSGVCRVLRRTLAVGDGDGPVPNGIPLLFSPGGDGAWREQPLSLD